MGKGIRYSHIEKILKDHIIPHYAVLEIGCGGAVYKDLFDNYIGIDLPENTYEYIGDVDVYCHGEVLPFNKETFDIIFMVACLYQIPDTQAVLNESKRVLKDYGRILIFDYNLKTTKRLKKTEKEGNNQNHIWSPFKLASRVRKSGFKTSIVYDYRTNEPSARWKRFFLKLKIVKYLKTLINQRKEGWNIVIGEKI